MNEIILFYYTDSIKFLLYSSSTLILSSFEILANVSMSGCDEFVHHLETVDGLTPSSSDSHLLVFFCSTNTIFRRFTSCIHFKFLVWV